MNDLPLEKWKQKWKKDGITLKTKNILQQQFNYCMENKLNYAPVLLVNGNLLPKEYNINELKYFIGELEEKQKLVLV